MRPADPTSRMSRQGLFSLSLHTEIVIAASPQAIWQALTDFPAYAAWNPYIPKAAGEARAGSRLAVEIAWPGLKRGP